MLRLIWFDFCLKYVGFGSGYMSTEFFFLVLFSGMKFCCRVWFGLRDDGNYLVVFRSSYGSMEFCLSDLGRITYWLGMELSCLGNVKCGPKFFSHGRIGLWYDDFFFVGLRFDFQHNFQLRLWFSEDGNYFVVFRLDCGSIDFFLLGFGPSCGLTSNRFFKFGWSNVLTEVILSHPHRFAVQCHNFCRVSVGLRYDFEWIFQVCVGSVLIEIILSCSDCVAVQRNFFRVWVGFWVDRKKEFPGSARVTCRRKLFCHVRVGLWFNDFFFVRLRADFGWNFQVRFNLSADRNYFVVFRSGCGSIDIFQILSLVVGRLQMEF